MHLCSNLETSTQKKPISVFPIGTIPTLLLKLQFVCFFASHMLLVSRDLFFFWDQKMFSVLHPGHIFYDNISSYLFWKDFLFPHHFSPGQIRWHVETHWNNCCPIERIMSRYQPGIRCFVWSVTSHSHTIKVTYWTFSLLHIVRSCWNPPQLFHILRPCLPGFNDYKHDLHWLINPKHLCVSGSYSRGRWWSY